MRFLSRLIRFVILLLIKSSRYLIYPTKVSWVANSKVDNWSKTRLLIFLNHTSLLEFLFATAIPTHFLWQMSDRLVFPVAEETLKRFGVGFFLRFLAPRVVPISRKRDDSWQYFLDTIRTTDSILIYLPEGRMKRRTGFDKSGKAMTVRGGILEVLETFQNENMIIAYSKGLHHVLSPEQNLPRLFKNIDITFESINVNDYLANFKSSPRQDQKLSISKDLEERRDRYCT